MTGGPAPPPPTDQAPPPSGSAEQAPPAIAPTRGRLAVVIAVLGGVVALGPASMDLYMPALPRVADDLNASTAGVALTMTAFLVGLGVGMLFIGSWSDSIGRRRPLLVGLVAYVVAALGCALAPSIGVLVALRFVLGMTSAGGHAIGQAVIADYTRGSRAARLLSRMALVSFLAPVVAPILGAQLLRVTSWRGIFVVLAVFGVAIWVTAFRFVGESLPPERRIASGVRTTLSTARGLLRDPRYVGIVIMAAFSTAAFYAYLTGVSLVFQDAGGLSPTGFSVLFTINAAGMLAATQVNHRLLARFTPRQILGAALVVAAAAGAAAVAVSFAHPLNVVALAATLFVVVTATAFLWPNAVALALSLHPETAGSASAVYGATGIVLGALATPLVGVGGESALSMTVVMLVATLGALTVYLLGPRRHADVLDGVVSDAPRGDRAEPETPAPA